VTVIRSLPVPAGREVLFDGADDYRVFPSDQQMRIYRPEKS